MSGFQQIKAKKERSSKLLKLLESDGSKTGNAVFETCKEMSFNPLCELIDILKIRGAKGLSIVKKADINLRLMEYLTPKKKESVSRVDEKKEINVTIKKSSDEPTPIDVP